jgi:hypothetical protein
MYIINNIFLYCGVCVCVCVCVFVAVLVMVNVVMVLTFIISTVNFVPLKAETCC